MLCTGYRVIIAYYSKYDIISSILNQRNAPYVL